MPHCDLRIPEDRQIMTCKVKNWRKEEGAFGRYLPRLKLIFLIQKNLPCFIKPEGSLPCSQEPTSCPYS